VQAFYTINWFHDRMLGLGFDEASGNFQQVNLQGQGGLGGDRVAADVQNTGANNASFSTPAKLGAMTVHAWSLLIKPRNFTCQIFIPSDAIFVHGFEAGTP